MTKLFSGLKDHGGALATIIGILLLFGGFAAYVIGAAEAKATATTSPLVQEVSGYKAEVREFRLDIRELYKAQTFGQRSARLEAPLPSLAEDVP